VRVCVRACVRAFVRACVRACMHACVRASVCVRVCVRMCVCECVCMCASMCIRAYIHANVCVCVFARECTKRPMPHYLLHHLIDSTLVKTSRTFRRGALVHVTHLGAQESFDSMSREIESWYALMSHVTYKRVMSHVNGPCHI